MVVSRITRDAKSAQNTAFLTLLENRDPQGIHVVNSTLEAFQKNTFLIHAWVHALLKFGQNPREYFVNLATNPFPQW